MIDKGCFRIYVRDDLKSIHNLFLKKAMNKGKYVFAQVAECLPARIFDKLVAKYSGDKKVHHFTCWNQKMAMIFGQINNTIAYYILVQYC